MDELEGKVAVVTGGGSGIGRGICLAAAEQGMHVVVADVEGDAAEETAALAKERGAKSLAVPTDVTDPAAVDALAQATYHEFGAAHLLCNNAGVLIAGAIEQMTAQDLDWMLAVNLHGVVNGVQAFVPRMREQEGEKQIVNTASMSGLVAGRGGGALGGYVASKFAVVGLTESLQIELAPEGIAVALFCPGATETRIGEAQRNRQQAFGPAREVSRRSAAPPDPSRSPDTRRDPLAVGRLVIEGVRDGRAYIITHPETRALIEGRTAGILAGYDAARPGRGR